MARQAHFVVVGGGTAGWIAAFIIQDSIRRLKLDASVGDGVRASAVTIEDAQ